MPWELSASRCAETSVPESTVTSASQVVMSSFALVILKVCGVFFCEKRSVYVIDFLRDRVTWTTKPK